MEGAPTSRQSYRHGNVPDALLATAQAILEQEGPNGLTIRKAARRFGVSSAAAYRHFKSREEFVAFVASEGFRKLTAAMKGDAEGRPSLAGIAPAYMEFALRNRGLFRLMFGPLLGRRADYSALEASVNDALEIFRDVTSYARDEGEKDISALAIWCLLHGLSALLISGLVPESRVQEMVMQILVPRYDTRVE